MTVDDLSVGMWVTVRDWYQNTTPAAPSMEFSSMMFGTIGTSSKKRDWMGTPLRIEALSLPYAACRVAFKNKVVVLDLRDVELTRITPEFLAVMRMKHEAESRSKASTKGWGYNAPISFVLESKGGEDDD